MKKRDLMLVSMMFAALVILPLVSASISFSSPDSTNYSLGQDFSTSVVLTSSDPTNGFFISSLVCGSQETEIFRMPVKMSANEQKTIPLSLRLDRSLIGSSSGECLIRASYNGDSESSEVFDISSELDVTIDLPSAQFNPGDNVTITGTVSKRNSQIFSGTVEASIPDLNGDYAVNVSGSSFYISVFIPEDAKATIYSISINAYESVDGEITNQGDATKAFAVRQVPKSIDLAIGTTELTPGNDLTYEVSVKDQSGEDIPGKNVYISIIDSGLNIFENSTIDSGESGVFKTKSNYLSGQWEIDANLEDLNASRTFNVIEFASASFTLINNTLVVENKGNTLYNKTIQIMIGDTPQSLDLTIAIGETKQYILEAPDGDYPISVNNGDSTEALGRAFLTGNVIDVKDIAEAVSGKYMIFGWIVIILILAWIIYRIYQGRSNKSFYGKTNYFSPVKVSSQNQSESTLNSTSMSHGEKQECAVFALKIRNMNEIKSSGSNALETINIALAKARSARATVFEQNDVKVIVIPISAVKEDLAIAAARLAQDMDKILSEHNKKYSHKIDYGLGANIGELIVERVQGKYKFNSIGNTIQLAKRAADSAKNEAYITESIRTKAMKDIKVERKGDYWIIIRIVARDAHNEFINKFMQRQRQN